MVKSAWLVQLSTRLSIHSKFKSIVISVAIRKPNEALNEVVYLLTMYILDTDHLSFIQRNGQEGKQILARLAAIEELEVAVTVITYSTLVSRLIKLAAASVPSFSEV